VTTGEYTKLLARQAAVAAAKPLTDVACPLLREVVDHGCWAFQRCHVCATGERDVDLAPLVLFRDLLDAADGVEVLIASSCGTAAEPLLRCVFEDLVSLRYVLQQDYETRSLCWLCGYVHKQLRFYRQLDSSTEEGTGIDGLLSKQFGDSSISPPLRELAAKGATGMKQFLKEPHMEPIEKEWIARKKKLGRTPKWYSLHGGPCSIQGLASAAGLAAEYELLYRMWSAKCHANDAAGSLTSMRDGRAAFWALRSPAVLRENASLMVSFVLKATQAMLAKFRPQEDMSSWYANEVLLPLRRLNSMAIKLNPVEQ
jgi:hypothetical protein